jgi:hypothetical protein
MGGPQLVNRILGGLPQAARRSRTAGHRKEEGHGLLDEPLRVLDSHMRWNIPCRLHGSERGEITVEEAGPR